MNIVFVFSCLNPGKDGVGDYTTKLATQLTREGHVCLLVSANGRIRTTMKTQHSHDGITLKVLQMSAYDSWSTRFRFLKAELEEFRPDVVSLQFVPYGFSLKGVPIVFVLHFRRLVRGIPLHLMFHELAVGADASRWVQRQIIRRIQNRLIRRLLAMPSLVCASTHLPFYYQQLEKWTKFLYPLPLFANINPVPRTIKDDAGIEDFFIVMFGQVRANTEVFSELTKIVSFYANQSVRVTLTIIGSNREELKKSSDFYSAVEGVGRVESEYNLSEGQVAAKLSEAQLALTPVPRHALGKSGSVAAFLSAGVPVLAPHVLKGYLAGDIGFFDDCLSHRVLYQWNHESWLSIYQSDAFEAESISLPAISKQFVSSIQAKSSTFRHDAGIHH